MNIDALLTVCTPLHSAAACGHTETVRVLVKELGADVNVRNCLGGTPLLYVARNGHTGITRTLVKELGADVNAKVSDRNTPLHFAAY